MRVRQPVEAAVSMESVTQLVVAFPPEESLVHHDPTDGLRLGLLQQDPTSLSISLSVRVICSALAPSTTPFPCFPKHKDLHAIIVNDTLVKTPCPEASPLNQRVLQ